MKPLFSLFLRRFCLMCCTGSSCKDAVSPWPAALPLTMYTSVCVSNGLTFSSQCSYRMLLLSFVNFVVV